MPMTIDELNAIKKRLAAAMKCDDWGSHGTKELTFTPEKPGHNAAVWYGDGDQCADVHGNLGLGIDGDAVAEFFAKSIEDVTNLVAEVNNLNLQNQEYKSSADLWATRWSGLKGNFEKLEKENAQLLLQNSALVEMVPCTVGAHTEGFPCKGCEALKKLGITRVTPFEKRNDECTCGWKPHLLDCPAKINQGRR